MTVCVLSDFTWLPLLGVGRKPWYIWLVSNWMFFNIFMKNTVVRFQLCINLLLISDYNLAGWKSYSYLWKRLAFLHHKNSSLVNFLVYQILNNQLHFFVWKTISFFYSLLFTKAWWCIGYQFKSIYILMFDLHCKARMFVELLLHLLCTLFLWSF